MVEHDAVRRAHGFYTLRVKDVIDETSDAKSFVIEVPDELRAAFAYRAGQYCTFRVRIDGEPLLRAYSMSSSPETDDTLAVTVKRVPGGRVSNWLNDTVAPGQLLELTRPAGSFCLRADERPVIAYCGGSGITPVMSIAKHLLATRSGQLDLLYANREPSATIFARELRLLGQRYRDRLKVTAHFDSQAGLLDTAAVAAHAERGLGADFYICGPPPFMDLVERVLLSLGVPREQIFIERFDVGDANHTKPGAVSADAEDAAATTITVVLDAQPHAVPCREGETILAAARRAGLLPPSLCEEGNCATCVAIVREGSVTMRTNDVLTPEEIDAGWVLTCQTLVRSARLTVEYEPM